ncbi:MAG TPA: hypothetical protein VHQ47_10250, partial [Phycisphaerae bacterium]|nr:hypothetical protein [Phycisphaerae bacterium]
MLDAVKRFATKVLLLHLVLLAVVIFGVVLGTRQVYTGAQREAQEESAARLEVIGKQTSAAIETQYQSIVSDMGILLRNASAATQPATQPEQTAETKAGAASTQPGVRQRFNRFNGRGGARAVAAMFASMGGQPVNDTMVNDMWKQLQGRISQLFVVDNQTGEVTMSLPSDEEGTAQALATAHLEWFKGLKSASMKAFAKTNGSEEDAGYHLLAIPTVWTDLRGGRGFGQG